MIVGTEGPDVIEGQEQEQEQDQGQGEVKDTPPGPGQVTDDGGGDGADTDQGGGETPEQKAPAETPRQESSSGKGGTDQKTQAKKTDDGSAAPDPMSKIARNIALAEAMKPLEGPTADLYSPDKQKARDDIRAAYKKATADSGDLRVKLDKAHERFDRAAGDMLPRLANWLKLFDKDQPIGRLLGERRKARTDLDKTMGDRERARADAQNDAKKWADAHANWSSPAEKMTAMVGEYADKIDKLSGEINTAKYPEWAMLSFWLEVAPKHVQLTDLKFSANANQAIGDVRNALAAYGLDAKLKNGKDRKDGSLYVLKEDELQAAREGVLSSWIAAAEKQADAEAAFKQNPDDAATVKARWDKLKDDAWLQQAKAKLEKNGG